MRSLHVLLLFGLLIGGSVSAAAAPSKIWGVCIGISEYGVEDLTLKWADKDAIEFSTFLRYGLGLAEDQYRILKNREATRESIRDAFGWLNLVAGPDDRVFIFYSGHGKDNSPIVPYDTENLFTLEAIKKALSKIEAREIIFLADACYSGKIIGKGARSILTRESITGLKKDVITEIAAANTNVVIITSANGIQEAYELDGQKNGLFTYYLMNALMDKASYTLMDADENQAVTLYEVYRYVYRQVTRESAQEPQISDVERAKEIVLFADIAANPPDAAAKPTSTNAPRVTRRLGTGSKVAFGLGAAALIGGGVAVAAGGGNDSESSPTPQPTVTPGNPDAVSAELIIAPAEQTACGSVSNQLYVTNLNNIPITIERIDYAETLIAEDPAGSCQPSRRGAFLPDLDVVQPQQASLIRNWTVENYPCSACPYQFTQCQYQMSCTIKTSVGVVNLQASPILTVLGANFCP